MMLNIAFYALLAAAIFGPWILLLRKEELLSWRIRYFLSAVPVIYTGGGWLLAVVAEDYFDCLGGMKGIHNCWAGDSDVTLLIAQADLFMPAFIFLALPISLWLLTGTDAKRTGTWRHDH